MKAEAFLLQIKKYDRIIKNALQDIVHYKSMAEYAGISYAGMGVQVSKGGDRVGDAVASYADMEKELEQVIADSHRARYNIITTIEKLPYDEYIVLYGVYVQGKTLYDISDDEEKSRSWAASMKGKALKDLQAILDEKEDGKRSEQMKVKRCLDES